MSTAHWNPIQLKVVVVFVIVDVPAVVQMLTPVRVLELLEIIKHFRGGWFLTLIESMDSLVEIHTK